MQAFPISYYKNGGQMILLETEQTDFPSPPKLLINNLNYINKLNYIKWRMILAARWTQYYKMV